MTECSGGDWQDDPFANTIDLIIGSMANWARAISLWNMALDENEGPQNNGCPDCRGVITVNSQSGDVTYNADYYAPRALQQVRPPRRGPDRVELVQRSLSTRSRSRTPTDASRSSPTTPGRLDMTVQVGTGAIGDERRMSRPTPG